MGCWWSCARRREKNKVKVKVKVKTSQKYEWGIGGVVPGTELTGRRSPTYTTY
jgi:hypothetical protein